MDLLQYFQLFHNISEEELRPLFNSLKSQKFKKGEFITTLGQVQKNLYFINSGEQMSYFDADKKIQVIAFCYPPNLCGVPESFFFQKPSNCYLVCLSDTVADYISYDDLQKLFDESKPIERLFRKMTEAILSGVINRHIELHTLTMEERFITFCRRSPHLLQLVQHKYIASYLGIDPTNFSKLFNTVKI